MNILGINAFHGDSSAALIQDGMLVAAVEEERFTRIKHWAGFPVQSIRYCLKEGGITVKELDHVAVSFDPKANLTSKILFTLKSMPDLKSVLDRLKRQIKSFGVMDQLAHAFDCDTKSLKAQFHPVEHHTAHLASTFFTSPFERAAILSVDGMGDFVSSLMASGEGADFKIYDRVYYPHSVGFLYCAATMLLGFPHYGDEYKVMGLAPYGTPSFVNDFRDIIYPKDSGFELNLDYFTHHKQCISMLWNDGARSIKPFHSKLMENTFGLDPARSSGTTSHHENVAASLQYVTEENRHSSPE